MVDPSEDSFKEILDQVKFREDILSQKRPFFLYSSALVKGNIDNLRNNWGHVSSRPCDIFYSVKANPNPHWLKLISTWVDGFDVSSYLELDLLTQLKIDPHRISLSGPAKTDKLLERAVKEKVRVVHLDSLDEYFVYQQILDSHQKICGLSSGEDSKSAIQSCAYTLRLAYSKAGSHKLGFEEEELRKLLDQIKDASCSGFHIYLGRESFSQEVLIDLATYISQLRTQHSPAFNDQFSLYCGAGLPSSNCCDLKQMWGNSLNGIESIVDFPIPIESGRFITNTAGVYGTQILSVKRRGQEKDLVIINGGLQHLAANLESPLYGSQHVRCWPKRTESRESFSQGSRSYSIYGSLGLWNDCILPNVQLPSNLKRGDWLIFFPTGAYGYTAAANQFIGLPPPEEWLVKEKDTSLHLLSNISPTKRQAYQMARNPLENG